MQFLGVRSEVAFIVRLVDFSIRFVQEKNRIAQNVDEK